MPKKSSNQDLGSLIQSIAKKNSISLTGVVQPVIAAGGVLPQVVLQGVPQVVPQGMPQVVLQGVPQVVQQGVPQVVVPLKKCGTYYRGDSSVRYTRAEIENLAKTLNIPFRKKTMTQLCAEMGIEPSRVVGVANFNAPLQPAYGSSVTNGYYNPTIAQPSSSAPSMALPRLGGVQGQGVNQPMSSSIYGPTPQGNPVVNSGPLPQPMSSSLSGSTPQGGVSGLFSGPSLRQPLRQPVSPLLQSQRQGGIELDSIV
jgi:hypothetical protein